jgi:hypothetical protein
MPGAPIRGQTWVPCLAKRLLYTFEEATVVIEEESEITWSVFFFDLLFSRNLMKSLKTLAVTLGWVSQPQVADLVCLLGNLILLSSMAVDLGSGAGFSPEKRGRITHYTTNWRWCLSLSLEPKLNWTAEPQGVRQSCQNSADRSGFCKPPEGWHADKLEWHRLPSTIASLASLFYLVSLLAIL